MSDIFISYARSTEAQAARITEALRALGYNVWRDDELPAHRAYAEVIEERLAMASAVVVAWSADAVKSQWVFSEANRARESGKLVQLSLDTSRLPMPFDTIQCADLAGWNGDLQAVGWRKVADSLSALVGAAAPVSSPKSNASAEPLLAVLAFDNLSGDPEMAFFSDGVSEEIQQTVARTTGVKVIGRASSFHFRGADKAAAHVAAELAVSHILDGSVRRSGQRLRISAQLVECARETTLWSERFDRELSDVFALQDEIAESVAAALKLAFAPSADVGPIDPAVYDLYLKHRDIGPATDRAQVRILEQVVAAAPKFAPAWATLAFARAVVSRSGERDQPYELLRAAAVEAGETALRLDPRMGDVHTAFAWLEPYAAWARREAHFRQAISTSPDAGGGRAWLGNLLAETGRLRAALDTVREAFARDPLFPEAANQSAFLMAYAGGDPEEVQALYERFRERFPGHGPLTIVPATIAAMAGDARQSERLCALAEQTGMTAHPAFRRSVAFARALVSRDPQYMEYLKTGMRRQVAKTGTVGLDAIYAASFLGLTEEAFAAVEAASFEYMYRADSPLDMVSGGWATTSFLFDVVGSANLMADVRFVSLCAKLGLCDYWVQTGLWPDCADSVPYDFRAEARRLTATPNLTPQS